MTFTYLTSLLQPSSLLLPKTCVVNNFDQCGCPRKQTPHSLLPYTHTDVVLDDVKYLSVQTNNSTFESGLETEWTPSSVITNRAIVAQFGLVYPRMEWAILHAFRKHSPDGVAREKWPRTSGSAYYSSVDPERIKGWVGLVGWPYSGWFIHISGHRSATGRA